MPKLRLSIPTRSPVALTISNKCRRLRGIEQHIWSRLLDQALKQNKCLFDVFWGWSQAIWWMLVGDPKPQAICKGHQKLWVSLDATRSFGTYPCIHLYRDQVAIEMHQYIPEKSGWSFHKMGRNLQGEGRRGGQRKCACLCTLLIGRGISSVDDWLRGKLRTIIHNSSQCTFQNKQTCTRNHRSNIFWL